MSSNSCRQEKGQGYLKSRGSYSPEIEYRETRLRLTSPKRITVFQCIICQSVFRDHTKHAQEAITQITQNQLLELNAPALPP